MKDRIPWSEVYAGQVGDPIKKITIVPKENPVPSEPEPAKTPAPAPKPEKIPA